MGTIYPWNKTEIRILIILQINNIYVLDSKVSKTTAMLTSSLPLGVWLFGSCPAALAPSVFTLSLFSSVVQEADDAISATIILIQFTCRALTKPHSCLPVPSRLVKEDWEDRSARSGGSSFHRLPDPETWLLPLPSSVCWGWSLVCGCEWSGCVSSLTESIFSFSSKRTQEKRLRIGVKASVRLLGVKLKPIITSNML